MQDTFSPKIGNSLLTKRMLFNNQGGSRNLIAIMTSVLSPAFDPNLVEQAEVSSFQLKLG